MNYQLYTIHAVLEGNHTVPLVYCLCRNRTQVTYDLIFDTLKQAEPELNPTSVTTDYEKAAINSIQTCFPNTTMFGCFFHFGQCLWRKVQSLGLQTWYNNPSNALIIKSIQALSFVPIAEVRDCFNEYVSHLDSETDEVLSEFLVYFETTWIGILQNGRMRRPTYDPKLWNVRERLLDGIPRTTNSIEGWHRGFEQRMTVKHPNIGRLVSKLRSEQADWELKLEQMRAGITLRAPVTKYQLVTQRLFPLMDKYEEYGRVDFLRAVAHNL